MGSKRNLVSKNLYLKNLKKNAIKGNVKNQRTYKGKLVARMFMAKKLNKVIFYNKGIFKITGFTKNRSGIHFTKRLIYMGGQKSAKISATNNFQRALEKPVRDFQNIYYSQIRKLLRMKEII
jgi:thioredoxin-related protein